MGSGATRTGIGTHVASQCLHDRDLATRPTCPSYLYGEDLANDDDSNKVHIYYIHIKNQIINLEQ